MSSSTRVPPPLPAAVLDFAGRGEAWAGFVAALPGLLRGLLGDWELAVTGPVAHGHTSVVLPVRAGDSTGAVLKVGFPDEESEHEGLALQRWQGDRAIRLLRADPHRRALLLERAHPADLGSVGVLDACEVVAGLYGAVHVPALPQLRPMSRYVAPALDRLAELPRSVPLPHRLVEQAVSLGRELLTDPRAGATLIHTDLHYGNVLASARPDAAEVPWLVIDPKPVAGDPHYEPAPLLWNRWDEVAAATSVREAIRSRFFTVVDAAMLDEDRARGWVVVRMMLNALAETHEPVPDAEWLTRMVTIAKAVQD